MSSSGVELIGGTVEVVGGEQPQRDHLDADLLGPAEQRLDVGRPARWPWAVSAPTALRPPAVAVEHHADVLREPLGREGAHHASLVGRVEHPRSPRFQSAIRGSYPGRCARDPDLARNLHNLRSRNLVPMNDIRQRFDDAIDRAMASRSCSDKVTRSSRSSAAGCMRGRCRSRAAFAVLIALSPTAATRVGNSVYAASALLLFTVSGFYHRGNWSTPVWAFLRRFDHANIFVLIAGTYTPFAFLYLDGSARWAARGRLGLRDRGDVLQVPPARCASVAVDAALHRRSAGSPCSSCRNGSTARSVPALGERLGARAGRHRRHPLHARRRGLRPQEARTRTPPGSASTRCSTCSPSLPSCASTSPSPWRPTPCARTSPPRWRAWRLGSTGPTRARRATRR